MKQVPAPRPKPKWLRVTLSSGENYRYLKKLVHTEALHTVCEEARCPNLSECWDKYRTASFMLLGDTCTRHCRFCAVRTGLPAPVDADEPRRIAVSARKMGLRHVHLTMVNRDDLRDGGAKIVAETVKEVRRHNPQASIEVLTSDFQCRRDAVGTVVSARPDIFSHNIETIRRLTPRIRSGADYDRSLTVLEMAKALAPDITTKSSIMVGLGETDEEIIEVMRDLRARQVDMLNIGQYLQPSRQHAAVQEYRPPEAFDAFRDAALAMGFRHCEAGPLVRSSYHADDQYDAVKRALSGR